MKMDPQTVALMGYLICVIMPPFVGGALFYLGLNQRGGSWLSLALSAIMLFLWIPILLMAPQVIISLVYPAQ